jgi:hypothetical protein
MYAVEPPFKDCLGISGFGFYGEKDLKMVEI